MAFPIILRATSPIPMGRTPGHLSSGMRRQAVYACRLDGSTKVVEILLAKAARAEQRLLDFWPNAVQNRLQLIAFTPEGPADPSVWRADVLITSAVMLSQRIG